MLFISYRRDDSGGHVGRLYDAMSLRFGAKRLFFDIDHIAPGQDFAKVIDDAVTQCAVILVVIGKRWAGPGKRGVRRIDDPGDFVRLEVSAALRREGLLVIPVLVAGGQMPSPAELPDDLKELSRRNAFDLSDLRWKDDVARLIAQLETAMHGGRTRSLPKLPPIAAIPPTAKWGAAAAAALLVIGIGIALLRSAHRAPVDQVARTVIPTDMALPSGTATPVPSVAQAARDVLGKAQQQWFGDAALTTISVDLTRGSGRPDYKTSFEFRSASNGKRLVVVMGGGIPTQFDSLRPPILTPIHKLPDTFVDLPSALATARHAGMIGDVGRAVLSPGTSDNASSHALWMLKATPTDQARPYYVDAVADSFVAHPTRHALDNATQSADGSSSGSSLHHAGLGGLFSKVKSAVKGH
jgi:hypothetical protein